jgi:hypothetical protein
MRRRTRLASVLAAIALTAGLTLAGAGTARADVIPPAGWAEIYNAYLHAQGNTLCFNDPGASTSSGTQLNLYRCFGYSSSGARQRWVFLRPEDDNGNPIIDDGHPVYEIYNVAAGLCLSAANLGAGMPVTLGTCNRYNTRAQIWWELLGTNSPAGPDFEIFPWPVEYTYGNCVAPSNSSDSNSTPLVMERCDGTNGARIWRLG